VLFDGSKFWHRRHYLHRLDGPSVEYVNQTNSYFLYNGALDPPTACNFKKLQKILRYLRTRNNQ
jgi:hypothetical protein